MPFVPDRRTVLRLVLYLTAVFLGAGSPALASEMTAPIEQLHTGLIEIMKAGKVAPFRQRYDKIAPVIGRTFDLEVIVRQVVGPRWAALMSNWLTWVHSLYLEVSKALGLAILIKELMNAPKTT